MTHSADRGRTPTATNSKHTQEAQTRTHTAQTEHTQNTHTQRKDAEARTKDALTANTQDTDTAQHTTHNNRETAQYTLTHTHALCVRCVCGACVLCALATQKRLEARPDKGKYSAGQKNVERFTGNPHFLMICY